MSDNTGQAAELQPSFLITVDLDGDDVAETQAEEAQAALDASLVRMVRNKLIRGYTIERQRGSV